MFLASETGIGVWGRTQGHWTARRCVYRVAGKSRKSAHARNQPTLPGGPSGHPHHPGVDRELLGFGGKLVDCRGVGIQPPVGGADNVRYPNGGGLGNRLLNTPPQWRGGHCPMLNV